MTFFVVPSEYIVYTLNLMSIYEQGNLYQTVFHVQTLLTHKKIKLVDSDLV